MFTPGPDNPMIFVAETAQRRRLAFYAAAVPAGFPSPAGDYVEGKLDLNDHLIRHPAATFIIRVEGDSMTGAGIHPGDLLVVDRSIEPRSGHIVIAILGGDLTVKTLRRRKSGWFLEAANEAYPATALGKEIDCAIWGVVTAAIRRFVPR